MIERVHNMRASVVRKRLSNDEAGGSQCKKGRPKGSILLNRYPSLNTDLDFSDAASDERNRKALERELAREPPRKEYVRSLLRQTYAKRRGDILSDSKDVTVMSILTAHSALSFRYAVSL